MKIIMRNRKAGWEVVLEAPGKTAGPSARQARALGLRAQASLGVLLVEVDD